MSIQFIKDAETGEMYAVPVVKVDDIAAGVYERGRNDGFAEGKAEGLEQGAAEGENAGYDIGKAAAEAECAAKHFVATVTGDGTGTISFDVPDGFEPDTITVQCKDFETANVAGTADVPSILTVAVVTNSTGRLCGSLLAGVCTSTGSQGQQVLPLGASTLGDKYTRIGNTVTLTGFAVSGKSCVFGAGVDYKIICENVEMEVEDETA